MTLEHAYALIVDADADRIDAAIRACGGAISLPAIVARSGRDATQMLSQLGAPALLMIALSLPDGDGLSVLESLRHIDDATPVIAWTPDRDLREYAANRLAQSRAKVLGGNVTVTLFRRCVDALLGRVDTSTAVVAAVRAECEEDWLDLAERARQRLGVIGTATYTKMRGGVEYMTSVSWRPGAPTPSFPSIFTTALEEVLMRAGTRVWADLAPGDSGSQAALRSLAIVPIVRDREIAGALCAFDVAPNAFGQSDLEMLTSLAGGSAPRRGVAAIPMDREDGEAVIKRELARVSRDHQPLSVMLFAISAGKVDVVPAVDDIMASAVRGNDVVVRWTSSEVLVVLSGADRGVARRVAERIRGVVKTRAANECAVSGAVSELRTSESFEDTVAKVAERLQNVVLKGHPRIA